MAAPRTIEPVSFRNPRFPALAVEAMSLHELRRRVPGRHLHGSSRPEFHQLIHLHAGRTPHFVDFVRHELERGCVLHVRPGQVQQLVLQPHAQGTIVLFAPEFVPREAVAGVPLHRSPAILDAAVPDGLLRVPAGARAGIQRAFAEVLREYAQSDGGPLSAAVLRHLVSALLLMLARVTGDARAPADAAGSAASRVYARFAQEVERGFAGSRSVLWYADRLGYSEKTLLRACQAVAGVTPKEWIDRRVVLEAKRRLAHSQDSVGGIGADLGFAETTNFAKFFRRREGLSPAEFRRLHARGAEPVAATRDPAGAAGPRRVKAGPPPARRGGSGRARATRTAP